MSGRGVPSGVDGPEDIRAYFEKAHLGAWDLQGRDVTVVIRAVSNPKLRTEGGGTQKKPVVFFEGTEKSLVLNKTNTATIVSLYGTKVGDWIGKRITLYPTTTKFGRETVDAIRIRPKKPSDKPRGVQSQPVDPGMRDRQTKAAQEAGS